MLPPVRPDGSGPPFSDVPSPETVSLPPPSSADEVLIVPLALTFSRPPPSPPLLTLPPPRPPSAPCPRPSCDCPTPCPHPRRSRLPLPPGHRTYHPEPSVSCHR